MEGAGGGDSAGGRRSGQGVVGRPGLRHLSDGRLQELERHELMMGMARGRLAVTLDVLTDALILVGQHGVYCHAARDARLPALDLQAILADIEGAKELVASVMERLREERDAASSR